MKKSILAVVLCLTLSQANASNLVQMDMKKVSDNAVDVTLYTTDISSLPMVTKKANNKYVILMPNVSGNTTGKPNFSSLKDIVSDVDVKSVDDGMNGYTKVTLTTTRPIDIKTQVQKAAPVSAEENVAKSLIAQVKTKPVQAQKTVTNTQTNTDKKSETQKVVQKVEKKQDKVTVSKPVTQKTTPSPLVTETKVEKQTNTTPIDETSPLIAEDVIDPVVKINELSTIDSKIDRFTKEEKPAPDFTWMLFILPFLFLYMLAKMVKNSMHSTSVLKESFKEHLSVRPFEEKSYEDIISDSELNWQEKYKKFVKESDYKVAERKYNFIKPIKVTETDIKRLEYERMLDKTPKTYENLDIEIVEDNMPNVKSEDFVIQQNMSEEFRLKAFAKPNALVSSRKTNVSKLLPKYSHAKEGKFIKLFETPLNSTSRKFANANLKVSDLINTSSKYLKDNNKDVEMVEKEQNYVMSSIDEYFAILDKEQTKRVTNPNRNLSKQVAASLASVKPSMSMKKPTTNQVSNPISKRINDYKDGLIIKDSYTIDDERSFHIVSLDGVPALIGRINNDISVIKKFDSEVDKMQVRRDEENVYIVKVGSFKSMIDANNMGVLIEL